MAGLRESIETMIGNIDVYCDLLTIEDREKAASFKESMQENFTALINAMLGLYDRPEYSDVKEDKAYWINQRQRICDALDSEDIFFTIDVLRNETAENFKLYLKMLG
ncbi:MAG: hypothetical protein IJT16_04555 [Lachnospiraceae bacterium]|nr:hypothetical protein [Lachnospiraceae bacterium]